MRTVHQIRARPRFARRHQVARKEPQILQQHVLPDGHGGKMPEVDTPPKAYLQIFQCLADTAARGFGHRARLAVAALRHRHGQLRRHRHVAVRAVYAENRGQHANIGIGRAALGHKQQNGAERNATDLIDQYFFTPFHGLLLAFPIWSGRFGLLPQRAVARFLFAFVCFAPPKPPIASRRARQTETQAPARRHSGS